MYLFSIVCVTRLPNLKIGTNPALHSEEEGMNFKYQDILYTSSKNIR